MGRIDLTPFGFTPTESLIYDVLLTNGPGTGYVIARSAGLARANAYSALEGLVQKGAARSEGTRPRTYRPESPAGVIARITSRHGQALDQLTAELSKASVPATPSLVEIETPRAALQLLSHEIARAERSVLLHAPADAYPLLAPVLRRASLKPAALSLYSTGSAALDFVEVRTIEAPEDGVWPGVPFLAVIDDASALVAARNGSTVSGIWTGAPLVVAAARLTVENLAQH